MTMGVLNLGVGSGKDLFLGFSDKGFLLVHTLGSGVEDESVQVLLNSATVELKSFVGGVLSSEINSDSDGSSVLDSLNSGFSELSEGETSAELNLAVVSVGLTSDGGSEEVGGTKRKN